MGISVRDAADATKLRADIIENMESGEFNYKLPEIYKRGFLRIYAAFLKLDADAILDEYAMASRAAGGDDRRRVNILSRMATVASNVSTSAQKEFAPPPSETESRFESFDSAEEERESDTPDNSQKFVKMAVVFGAVILAAVVIILAVSTFAKRAPEENPDISINGNIATQPVSSAANAAMNEVSAPELKLALTALADTYVLVYQDIKTNDGKHPEPLYTGAMQAGERREFTSGVPLMVKLTDAERIKMERNGATLDLKGAKGLRLFRIVSK